METNPQSKPRSRRLILGVAAFALAAVASLGLVAGKAEAGPSHSKEILYFANAAKTQVVGIYELTCSGTVLQFGQKTRHNEETLIPCI